MKEPYIFTFMAMQVNTNCCKNFVTLHSNFKENMFSGIVEEAARVEAVENKGGNVELTVRCSFAPELRIDQSVAHNGVCLTVTAVDGDTYKVTAIRETLDRSNLGLLEPGDAVNLERSMRMDGRLDGHIVQGHVDCTGKCIRIERLEGSTYFTFIYDVPLSLKRQGYITVEKGSVTVNGVSLTVCDATDNSFRVAIIPYTFDHTNFSDITEGSVVNLEFDIIGKYVARISAL